MTESEARERALAYVLKDSGIDLLKAQPGSNDFKKIDVKPSKNPDGTDKKDANGFTIYESVDCLYNKKQMKKITIIFCTIILGACACKKETTAKDKKKYYKNPTELTLNDFKGDTLAYVQTKILDRKEYYIGKKFDVLLNDLNIPLNEVFSKTKIVLETRMLCECPLYEVFSKTKTVLETGMLCECLPTSYFAVFKVFKVNF